jgi:hypothetical protein
VAFYIECSFILGIVHINLILIFLFTDPGNPSEYFVAFYMVGSALPSDMSVSISANYTSASG